MRWRACRVTASPRRARVARTFQNIRLFAGMTVLENLLVAQHNMLMPSIGAGLLAVAGLGGHRRAERLAIERARLWLNAIGLLRRADDPAGALPYGDQRRLEIARAMCTGPRAALPGRTRRRAQPARERGIVCPAAADPRRRGGTRRARCC